MSQLFGHVPGYKPLVSPTSLLSGVLPRIRSLNPGITWQWDERKTGMVCSHNLKGISNILLFSLFQPYTRRNLNDSFALW